MTRLVPVLFTACALSVSAQQSTGPVPSTFTLAGKVVEGGSNRPLNHVLVSISPSEHREMQLSCITDANGRFAFTNLPEAKYSLAAEKRGEQPEAYNQDENYSTAIAVGPGLDSENIVFPLHISGSLSGNVVDDQGDPVPQAQVWLFQKRVFSGRSQIMQRGMEQTDSSGGFYAGHLAPGVYYVAVQARPWYAQNFFAAQAAQDQRFNAPGAEAEINQPASELDVAYPVTYYGDSTDAGSAAPITLSEGASVNIQITLRAVPAVHVVLTGVDPKGGVNTSVSTPGPGGFLIQVNGQTFNNGELQELTGIAPGRYVLTTQSFNQGRPEQTGTRSVELTDKSSLDIHDLPKTSLTGQVSFERNDRPEGRAFINLVPVNQRSNGPQNFAFEIASDGSLDTNNAGLSPGTYEVQIGNAAGFYVKSMAAKGAKVSGDEIDVPEGAAVQLSVLAAKGATRVNGIAVKEGTPIPGAMVLLVPQDLARTGQFRRDQSDSDGTFSLFDVVPGRYTLLAIDNGRDLEYENPAVINAYLSQGETLDVPLKDASIVKVTVQSRRSLQ